MQQFISPCHINQEEYKAYINFVWPVGQGTEVRQAADPFGLPNADWGQERFDVDRRHCELLLLLNLRGLLKHLWILWDGAGTRWELMLYACWCMVGIVSLAPTSPHGRFHGLLGHLFCSFLILLGTDTLSCILRPRPTWREVGEQLRGEIGRS